MLAIVICIGIWQPLRAQQPPTSTAELPSVLSGEEVVSRLIQRNLERAKPLDTFQGPGSVAWNAAVSRVPELRKWSWT